MARPRKQIDAEMVDKLAGLGCSAETIAHVVGADHKTIERRFGPIIKKGRERLNARLRQELVARALNGDTSCLELNIPCIRKPDASF